MSSALQTEKRITYDSCAFQITGTGSEDFRLCLIDIFSDMGFSSSDIRDRSFSKGLRGFKQNEVHSFLDHVAEKWDEMTDHVETLEADLDEANSRLERIEAAKNNAEERLKDMEDKEARLDEKEKELEQKEARLRSIASRLRTTLEEEQQELARFGTPDETAATSAPASDSQPTPDPERANGETPSESSSAPTPSDSGTSSDDATTEEWVDSLFPNRLPETDDDDQESSDVAEEETEEASQFEAIKEDVQGMEADDEESSSEDSEEAPPTDEMEQIWDVFDDPKM